MIRPMELKDLKRVAEIERVSYRIPWGMGSFLYELYRRNSLNYVYEDNEDVFGFYCCYLAADEIHLLDIAVDPSTRRSGIGGKLIEHLIHLAKSKSAGYIFLEVRNSNTSAQRLYEKYGFESVGIRKGYYQDNKEDAVLMTLYLCDKK